MYKGTFDPPGPGAWELESAHFQRPMSRWLAQVFPRMMMQGFKHGTARYGLLLDCIEVQIVDGFAYGCARPVGAPKTAKGPPPKFIFKLLARLHPQMRRRNRRATEVFANKLWREDVKLWDEDWKPTIVAANAALAAVDPTRLDTAALIAHLEAVQARLEDALFRHHALNPCTMVPTGDFLVHAKHWTGKSSSELLGLLRGSSPVSTGATAELGRLASAVRADADAMKLFTGGRAPAEIVDALRASPVVGTAMRAYLDPVGLRVASGYDVSDQYALEMPELLVGAIRAAVEADATTHRDQFEALLAEDTARVRDAVPAVHRDQFDEVLAEARLVYRIRDERGYLNDAFANGLARRALLAAGDILVAAGKLEARDHAVDLTQTEALALLRGEAGPSASEIAWYANYRNTKTVTDAPAHIGYPMSGPPPSDWLPSAAARMMRAVGAVLSEMFEQPEKDIAATVVRGVPASPGRYEGRARVVITAEQFGRVERGDVLIARSTCPSYNILLPLLGGIVTDRGGMLSHAAIVAREYGMPAVVGTTDGTKTIPDGARVRIDGSCGEVQVLS